MSAHEWGEPAGEENQQLGLRGRGLGCGVRPWGGDSLTGQC